MQMDIVFFRYSVLSLNIEIMRSIENSMNPEAGMQTRRLSSDRRRQSYRALARPYDRKHGRCDLFFSS